MHAATTRRGATAMEFALCLPFVLMLVITALDFSSWTLTQQAVSRAVQDGARVGSFVLLPDGATDGGDIETGAEDAVLQSLSRWGVDEPGMSVDATWALGDDGLMWLTVSAVVPFTSILGTSSLFARPVQRTFVVVTQEQLDA